MRERKVYQNPLFNTSSLKIPRKRRPVYRPTIHTILAAAAVLKLFFLPFWRGKEEEEDRKLISPSFLLFTLAKEASEERDHPFFFPLPYTRCRKGGNTLPFLRMKRKLSSGWKRQRISSKHVGNNNAFYWASKASFFFYIAFFLGYWLNYYSSSPVFPVSSSDHVCLLLRL